MEDDEFLSETATERLAALFRAWGAGEEASRTMARQLLRRALQRSREEGIPPLEALEALLRRIREAGREGGAGTSTDPPFAPGDPWNGEG